MDGGEGDSPAKPFNWTDVTSEYFENDLCINFVQTQTQNIFSNKH